MTARSLVFGDRLLQRSADTHADWCAGFGRCGQVRVIAASAIGHSHVREGRPRDDAFLVRTAEEWIAIAVSDGVGSHPNSRYGSSCAVEVLCETLLREATGKGPQPGEQGSSNPPAGSPEAPPREAEQPTPATRAALPARTETLRMPDPANSEPGVAKAEPPPAKLWVPDDADSYGTLSWNAIPKLPPTPSPQARNLRGMMRNGYQAAHSEVWNFARTRGLDGRTLGCTLLGLLINTQTREVVIGQVGDGLITCLDQNNVANPRFTSETSQPGVTTTITSTSWEQTFQTEILPGSSLRTLYVMTDGVSDDCLYPPPADIHQRWAGDVDREMRRDAPLSETATRLTAWLATYEARGSWDDRTLAVVLFD